jgi:F-actin capping protein, beta subunit.
MLSEQDHQLDCALDLMRRLPPHHVERNLSNLIDIVPDLCEDLLSSVDQPLKIQKDKEVKSQIDESYDMTHIDESLTFHFRLEKTICFVIIIAMAIRIDPHGLENMIHH